MDVLQCFRLMAGEILKGSARLNLRTSMVDENVRRICALKRKDRCVILPDTAREIEYFAWYFAQHFRRPTWLQKSVCQQDVKEIRNCNKTLKWDCLLCVYRVAIFKDSSSCSAFYKG